MTTGPDGSVRVLRMLPEHAEQVLATYRRQLTARPNFPLTGHARLAEHPDPQARRLAANDPTLPADVADELTRDPELEVRTAAAANPCLPERRIRAFLHRDDLARAAASNPALPAALLHQLCDEARVPRR